jgi:hypothetical protein
MSAIERLRHGLSAGAPRPFAVTSEWISEHCGADVLRAADGEVIAQFDEHLGGLTGGRRSVEMIRDAVNLAPVFLALCDAIAERNVAVCWSACDDQAQNVCHCGSDAVEGCPCALANSAIGAAWLNLVSIP